MNAVELVAALRDVYRRRPETRHLQARELPWMLYAKDSEEASAKRIIEGRPGITDQDFTRGRCRQVGRYRS